MIKKLGLLILSIFNLNSFGSCLISIENGGKNYMVTTWKHTEDVGDEITHEFFTYNEIPILASLLNSRTKMRFVFNEGVFTSMDYWDKNTKKWAQLSQAEKDAVFFIQQNFPITEK